MADWSSLPTDLVCRVGECLVVTNDIDSYVDVRAVCRNWRAAIPRPHSLGAGVGELRFRPRRWVMLDEVSKDGHDDGYRIFLHVSSGRILRQHLPWLRDHILLGDSDGLLILGNKRRLQASLVINPFTGDMVRFAAPLPWEDGAIAALAGTSSEEMLLYLLDYGSSAVCFADPASKLFQLPYFIGGPFDTVSMISYAGDVYLADVEGPLFKSIGRMHILQGHLMAETSKLTSDPEVWPDDVFLVVSAGDLLLIHLLDRRFKVFSVDVHQKATKPVRSIGDRALFLGLRSLSVDASKLPAVDGNCIYHYTGGVADETGTIYRYDLGNGTVETVSGVRVRPLSIVQVLLTYCAVLPDIKAQRHLSKLVA